MCNRVRVPGDSYFVSTLWPASSVTPGSTPAVASWFTQKDSKLFYLKSYKWLQLLENRKPAYLIKHPTRTIKIQVLTFRKSSQLEIERQIISQPGCSNRNYPLIYCCWRHSQPAPMWILFSSGDVISTVDREIADITWQPVLLLSLPGMSVKKVKNSTALLFVFRKAIPELFIAQCRTLDLFTQLVKDWTFPRQRRNHCFNVKLN